MTLAEAIGRTVSDLLEYALYLRQHSTGAEDDGYAAACEDTAQRLRWMLETAEDCGSGAFGEVELIATVAELHRRRLGRTHSRRRTDRNGGIGRE